MLTIVQFTRHLDDPENRRKYLEEEDIEITSSLNPDDPTNPFYTIRKIVRPDAIYLLAFLIEGNENLPPIICVTGDQLVSEQSGTVELYESLERYVQDRMKVLASDDAPKTRAKIEVFKLPSKVTVTIEGCIRDGSFTADSRPETFAELRERKAAQEAALPSDR